MHPQRTLIEAAHQIALDEIAFATKPEDDSPESYDHKGHMRNYIEAISKLPQDDSDDTLRAKEAALEQHHPMKFHALEAAESIASDFNNNKKPDLEDIMTFHFTGGYIPAIKKHHKDKYSKFLGGHNNSMNSHMESFQDTTAGLLETQHGLTIDNEGNVTKFRG